MSTSFVGKIAAPLVMTATLVACGSAGSDVPEDKAGGVISVTHSLGTTKVPADVERVVALGFVDEDALAALDITPVGYLGYQRDGQFPWQDRDLASSTDLESGSTDEVTELDLEKLASLNPDLILATGYWQIGDEYDRLSEVAPTIGPPTGVGEDSWQDNSELIGTALGRESDMAEQITVSENRVSAVVDDLPGLTGRTYVSAFNWTARDIVVNADTQSDSASLTSALGLTLSPALTKAVNPDGLTGADARLPLSFERLDLLDADLLVMTYADDALRQKMESNAAYAGLQVVRDKRVATLDRDMAAGLNNPTIRSTPWLVEKIRPELQRAAGG